MGLEISPATKSDVSRIVDIQFSAFEGNIQHKAMYPRQSTLSLKMELAKRRLFDELSSDYTSRMMKCTDQESGTILGYARWNIYDSKRSVAERTAMRHRIDWCIGREAEIAQNFFEPIADLREKLLGGQPRILLNQICVHKDCERRGAGSLLLKWGLDLANAIGLPIYLEATAEGAPLYHKMGFHEIGQVVVKAEDWDGDYEIKHIAMMRV